MKKTRLDNLDILSADDTELCHRIFRGPGFLFPTRADSSRADHDG